MNIAEYEHTKPKLSRFLKNKRRSKRRSKQETDEADTAQNERKWEKNKQKGG